MPKYLIQASYTMEGLKGLLKEGGAKRREVVRQAIESLGGKVETMNFAFGDSDVYIVVDLPDNTSAAAMGLATSAAGGARTKTIVLLTPEEIDAATKKSPRYRPPSG